MTATLAGLLDFLEDKVLIDLGPLDRRRVLELGARSDAFTNLLLGAGADLVCAGSDNGRSSSSPEDAEFVRVDLNERDFAHEIDGPFELIVAIDVIEHLESPLGFLRNVRALLHDHGRVVVTTPSADNLVSRLRFLATGQLRGAADDDPGRISPLPSWNFEQRLLPRAGLVLERRLEYPPDGFAPRPGWKRRLARSAGPVLAGIGLAADIDVYIFGPGPTASP
ncbi:MAG TPA: methyltransferase domain-containing protein [Acidimicrobiia bacterium]|jgi:hypothetical protein